MLGRWTAPASDSIFNPPAGGGEGLSNIEGILVRIPTEWQTQLPLLMELHRIACERVDGRPNAAVVRSNFEGLIRSAECSRLLNLMLGDLAADSTSEPDALGPDGHIVLTSGLLEPYIGIGLSGQARTDGLVHCVTSTTLLGALSSEGFRYTTWSPPEGWDPRVYLRGVQFTRDETRHCAFGDTVLLEAGTVFRYEEDGRLVGKVSFDDYLPFQWSFDSETGLAASANISTAEATILVYLLRFLAIYGDAQGLEAVLQHAEHSFHYVRWEAVKTCGRLSPETALDLVRRLAGDPHPEVRRAVERTLASMEH